MGADEWTHTSERSVAGEGPRWVAARTSLGAFRMEVPEVVGGWTQTDWNRPALVTGAAGTSLSWQIELNWLTWQVIGKLAQIGL